MSLYAVPITVEGRYWTVKLLIDSDTVVHAQQIAAATMGPMLAAAGVKDAPEKFVVGEPEALNGGTS